MKSSKSLALFVCLVVQHLLKSRRVHAFEHYRKRNLRPVALQRPSSFMSSKGLSSLSSSSSSPSSIHTQINAVDETNSSDSREQKGYTGTSLIDDVVVDDQHRRRILLGSFIIAVSTAGMFVSSSSTSMASDASIVRDPNILTTSDTTSIVKITASNTNSKAEASSLTTAAATTTNSATTTTDSVDWRSIFQKAGKRALGSGKAGAAASIVQVLSLMWLRTSMNYQYRYGGDLKSSLRTLWDDGGIARLYQGLPFALVQGPLTRFGDTAANVGILALLETIPETRDLPLPIKTACGSISAGIWRIILMPIDASKTSLQVEGQEGLEKLWNLVKEEGPAPLYYGALAQASATAAGHWPWFLTFNYVDKILPVVSSSDDLLLSLARSAFLGFCASCVSDVVSNSLRVIKTTKQTARLGRDKDGDGPSPSPSSVEITRDNDEPSYPEIVAMIIEKDGINGLLFRGLQTRLLTNSIQGALFSVVWKYLQQTQIS